MSAKQARAAKRRKAVRAKVEYSWGTVEYRGRIVVMSRRPTWYVAVDS